MFGVLLEVLGGCALLFGGLIAIAFFTEVSEKLQEDKIRGRSKRK
jgi:hypothetical protein